MPLLSKPAFGPPTALVYITLGALLDAWTLVWYFSFARNQEGQISHNTWFWLAGLFLTGVILMLIGFYLGRIGQAARKAELPPSEAQPAEAAIQQTAAATPHPVVAGAMPGQFVPAGGTIPAASSVPAEPPQYVPGVTRR